MTPTEFNELYGRFVDVSPIARKRLDVPYAHETERQRLDVYYPDEGEGPFPVIVFFHGGGFVKGDKRRYQMKPALCGLERGYAVVSAGYRLAPADVWPAFVNDAALAVAYVFAHADELELDPARVALWGESAGAQLALQVGLTPAAHTLSAAGANGVETLTVAGEAVRAEGASGADAESVPAAEAAPTAAMGTAASAVPATIAEPASAESPSGVEAPTWASVAAGPFDFPVRAIVDWYAPVDFAKTDEGPTQLRLADGRTVHELAFGLSGQELLSAYARANVLTHLKEGPLPAVLVEHGLADDVVPNSQSTDLIAALVARGVEVECRFVPGAGHGVGFFEDEDNLGLVFDFLRRHM